MFIRNQTFKGGFEQNAINRPVPQTLLTLVDMMIRCPSIVNQSVDEGEDPRKSASLSIAQ